VNNGRLILKISWAWMDLNSSISSPEKGHFRKQYLLRWISHIANHRTKDAQLWRPRRDQSYCNDEPKSAAWYFLPVNMVHSLWDGLRVKKASESV